ncbi:MAG: sulfate reduction electron transfer complex DsrMKJOP subunit DsrJ [Deltaproteobacteria bacterium]|nr:sulfate reduction electron transfer complex DsrMKJOP subunit DsrJ [Deltaproteobacteria bacterium]
MYDGGKIITGLVIFFVLLLFPVWYQLGKAAKAPDPELTEQARQAGQCVEETPFMRTQHMKLLDSWRNEVVRDAERYYVSENGKAYDKSLQLTCMECHSNKTKFCDQCHDYMGVDPFCWDCHIVPKENT